MSAWISVKERLPSRPEYDWVLVQVKLQPEDRFGIPHIAELRSDGWYTQYSDKPMEKELAIEVTHWMPLPDFPDISTKSAIQNAEVQFTTALGLLGEIMSYDYWANFPSNIRERAEEFLDQFDKTGTDPLFEAYRAAQRQAGREEMLAAVTESLDSSYAKGVADTTARYAALEEAARDVDAQFHAQEVADKMEGRPAPRYKAASIYLDIEKIRKALSELDEARKGEKNGR